MVTHLPPLRFNLSELGGAFGDIGTLVPLAITLIAMNGMNPTSVMLTAGLLYIGAGLYFRIPMPVQPLKAVAAIAIAQGLAPSVVTASGFLIGALLLILSLTRLIVWVARFFPVPVIRGIQLGLGLILLRTALGLILKTQVTNGGPSVAWETSGLTIPLGLVLAVAGAALVFLLARNRPLPASLALVGLGLGVSGFLGLFKHLQGLELGFPLPSFNLPRQRDIYLAFFLLVIPQLPLTLGNAVIAATDTARRYFGEGASRVGHRSLTASMGLANLLAGITGGMPVCHGSGGLSAHYRFGARSGAASLMMGTILLALALFLGKSLVSIFSLIPFSILGVLLAFTGVQHALLVRDMRAWSDWLVVAVVGVASLVLENLAWGFGLGILTYFVMHPSRLHGRQRIFQR